MTAVSKIYILINYVIYLINLITFIKKQSKCSLLRLKQVQILTLLLKVTIQILN